MERSKPLEEFLDKFTEKSFGKSLTDAEKEKVCAFCHKPIKMEDFRDDLSRKEYGISGLCQKCQDDTFGE